MRRRTGQGYYRGSSKLTNESCMNHPRGADVSQALSERLCPTSTQASSPTPAPPSMA